MNIHRFPDLEAMSWALVNHFVELSGASDRLLIALSGGNTPKRFYELLATQEDIDWSHVHLFLGDERYVPPTDPRSNERMIRELLVQHIDIPADHVHGMVDEAGWDESAKRYDRVLHQYFEGSDHTFDLALQGMGDDGHTASIFPGLPEPPLEPWVITTPGPAESPERLSVTLDCLARSKEVLFMVDGASKAARLREVIDGGDYPAAVLASKAKHVDWWLDEAAAALL